jgi:hypothetical protein
MTRHSRRAAPALVALQEADPALALLSLWCAHRDVADGPAARTGGETILYGPPFDALPRHEQVGLAAHHVLHVALRHGARMQALRERLGDRFDPALYALATDAIVNEALVAAGHAIPRPAVLLTGLLREVVGGPPPDPAAALSLWDAERLYFRLMQEGGEGRAAGAARAHARARAFVPDFAADRRGGGADRDGGDAALWRQHLARAMAAGRAAGRGIGALVGALADIPGPETPWEVILRRLLLRSVLHAPEPAWRRPSRGWIARHARARAEGRGAPGFEPGRVRDPALPRIAVLLDTSSSVGDGTLRLFLAEVAGIARRTGAQVALIAFDELPEAPVMLDPAGWQALLARFAPRRGGGTDFGPALAAAAALDPAAIVVLTDLDGPFGPPPRAPVIWAATAPAAAPPFGRLLDLGR